MARKLLAGVLVAAAFGGVGAAVADQLPILRSAKAVHRHLVLELSVGELRPVELAVATSRVLNGDGALVRENVRLRETINLPASANGVVRWRSGAALRRGIYFVQVKAVATESGGVTDCPPKLRNCNVHWSNVRRVVVPAPK